MKNYFSLFLILLFTAITGLNAQSVSIEKIKNFQLRNVGEIYKDNQVKGYYAFYKIEKIDRKTDAYLLEIFDENLGKVSSTRIPGSKFLYLLEAAFADESLMFKFYNLKERVLSFVQYNAKGEVVRKNERKLKGTWERAMIENKVKSEEIGGMDLFAVPKSGFLTLEAIKNKKLGYEISYIPEEKGAKGWKVASDENSKLVENPLFLAANSKIMVNTIAKRTGVASRKPDYFVQGIDMNSGQKRFEVSLNSKDNTISLLNGYLDEDEDKIILLGLYFEPGAKVMSDKSLGMCAIEMNYDGQVTNKRLISWGKDVAKFLPVNEKGKIEDVGFLYFHRFIKTEDGRVFGVAEQYRKAVSGGAVAMNMLSMASGGGSGVSNFKIVVENMVFMEFDPEFNLTDINIFEKGKSNINLPAGYGWYGPQILSLVIKSYGGFDYSYTQANADKSIFSIGYTDYDRLGDDKKKEVYFGSVTYSDGEFVEDKMPLNTQRNSTLGIYAAKLGYVMVLEYIRKTQTLDMRLEKVNF